MAAVLEGAREYLTRLCSHFLVFEADHQLVINIKAALVEIGRSDVHDIVDDN